jgi:hypothetical protein
VIVDKQQAAARAQDLDLGLRLTQGLLSREDSAAVGSSATSPIASR